MRFLIALLLLSFIPILQTWVSGAEPPNIVLMFIDNVGYNDLGCYGNTDVKTPAIDTFASEGVRCTDFYIASPSCMPSRAGLLTGRHPVRTGCNSQVWKIIESEQRVLPLAEKLLPQYLREVGYATACIGKWNLGFAPGHRPTERGFDEYLGNIGGNCDYVTHIYDGRHSLYRGIEPVKIDGYTTAIFADEACDFMRRKKDGPFLLYVPFNAAHFANTRNKPPGTPAIWQAPDDAFEAYGNDPSTLDETERYHAVLTALDHGIGQILNEIESLGLVENTLVVLLSDNGAFMLPGRGLECASNRPLKGGGTLVYEGGIRVPCLVRWPGKIPAGSICREPLSSMDFVVMSIVAAGGKLPDDRALDGRDATGALSGKAPSPHDHLYFHYGSGSAVRSGKYKLYRRTNSSPWELFDLDTDIGETANIAAANPRVGESMSKAFEAWYDLVHRDAIAKHAKK